jgi:hypothetical protein
MYPWSWWVTSNYRKQFRAEKEAANFAASLTLAALSPPH